jgi:hypothetical protein
MMNQVFAKEESMPEENEKLELARKIAQRKLGFVRHATIYLFVIIGLAVINNFTDRGEQWWLFVAFGWGIGVVAHFLSAFLYRSGSLVERIARREVEKMDETK